MSKIISLKNREFAEVYKLHQSKANKLLIMYVKKNDLDTSRLGISISKKVGNSVIRHRFCRLVRESYRLNQRYLKNGYDIVVLAKPSVVGVKCQQVEQAYLHLLGLHHLLIEDDV